jgi:Zn-dependent peptidase ImmA (M78 family)
MRSDTEPSTLDVFLEGMGMIWNPGAEALKVKQDFGVQSVEDIPLAAERAGFEICPVDLPANVSGFAQVIAGKQHIVVNRAKPLQHRNYTIAHELGHHVLHLDPSHGSELLGFMTNDLKEHQANLFATMLVVWTTKDNEQEEMRRQNPELYLTVFAALFLTLALIVIALVFYICSRLSQRQLPAPIEAK